MAIYRTVQMTFWTDAKVVDNFTPEDRYFYLYLFTNPHTNLCGCYEIGLRSASTETGYDKETIVKLLRRFESEHNVIRYDADTKEVLLLNWHKYNWTKSKDFRKPLVKEIESVKSVEFRGFLQSLYDGADTLPTPSRDGAGTTVTVTVTDTVTDTVTKNSRKGPTVSELRDEFGMLWSLYPKKQGKDKAFGYYERARKSGTTYEEVGQGIAAYREYIEANGIDMRYVKQGSTFFSQKAWADDWTIRNKREKSINEFFADLMEEHKDDL